MTNPQQQFDFLNHANTQIALVAPWSFCQGLVVTAEKSIDLR